MMKGIYVDHAATTPLHPEAARAMEPYLSQHFGNASSIHRFGREARAGLDHARRTLKRLIGAEKGNLVFTSGGTEADNLAILGTAFAQRERGKHIITTRVEHHAVLHACEFLEESGFDVTYLSVDSEGRISLAELERSLREDTILVSIMFGNNETGTIQPVREIGDLLKEKDVYFHTDAVQAFGLEPIDVQALHIDLLTAASHKINGPKGVGFLYVAPHVKLSPLLYGGSQERNLRAGTENVAGIVGFAKAAEVAYADLQARRSFYTGLKRSMLQRFSEAGVAFQINGPDPEQALPHILNLSFLQVKADVMLMNLDLAGVGASSGSACSAGSLQPSHVLLAMYDDEIRAETAIRFSFGYGNTDEDVREIVRITKGIVERLKQQV
jgi:cysteine desulfurase